LSSRLDASWILYRPRLSTRSLGAKNGQITSFLSYESRRGILTANATTAYYLASADLFVVGRS
jgi:hypothetical protein